jgi:asparaginyl-tRNA synthetase
MMFPLVKEILAMRPGDGGPELRVRGWVRTRRDMKNLVFVEVNDGSCLSSVQCTFDGFPVPGSLSTGASVEITGKLTPSPARGQALEIAASAVTVLGAAPAEDAAGIKAYPLQKKRHSLEFLREIPHLRGRTNTIASVMRVRSVLAFAVHRFFRERGFLYLHTPIITAHDAEGAGAMFRVAGPDTAEGGGTAFFGRESYLTVSGQLEAETYAMGLSRVYTFGPTFRAEHSNTARHLAEFWMIEPEAAFFRLEDNMALAEDFLKCLFVTALEECADDLAFFDGHYERGITKTLESLAASRFVRVSYTDAVAELKRAPEGTFEFRPYWGCDMQSEHEKYRTARVGNGAPGGPVIVTDYPKEIKAFYMKQNTDGKTVRAMDVLVPRLGEIIGGSEREDNFDALRQRMAENGLDDEPYRWYLDLRRYGSAPHSGFGLGFERLIQYVTGMANIRDVIPYPRAAGQIW